MSGLVCQCSRCDERLVCHLVDNVLVIEPCSSCWDEMSEQARLVAADAYLRGYHDGSSGLEERPPTI